jgi:hypothetical protein
MQSRREIERRADAPSTELSTGSVDNGSLFMREARRSESLDSAALEVAGFCD